MLIFVFSALQWTSASMCMYVCLSVLQSTIRCSVSVCVCKCDKWNSREHRAPVDENQSIWGLCFHTTRSVWFERAPSQRTNETIFYLLYFTTNIHTYTYIIILNLLQSKSSIIISSDRTRASRATQNFIKHYWIIYSFFLHHSSSRSDCKNQKKKRIYSILARL